MRGEATRTVILLWITSLSVKNTTDKQILKVPAEEGNRGARASCSSCPSCDPYSPCSPVDRHKAADRKVVEDKTCSGVMGGVRGGNRAKLGEQRAHQRGLGYKRKAFTCSVLDCAIFFSIFMISKCFDLECQTLFFSVDQGWKVKMAADGVEETFLTPNLKTI